MTQIGYYIAPSLRPDALGVHSLDDIALAVPALEEAGRYYAAFGLDVRAHGAALQTHAQSHRWPVMAIPAAALIA